MTNATPQLLADLHEQADQFNAMTFEGELSNDDQALIGFAASEHGGKKSVYRFADEAFGLLGQYDAVRHAEMIFDSNAALIQYAKEKDIPVLDADRSNLLKMEAALNAERKKLQIMVRKMALAAVLECQEWGIAETSFDKELRFDAIAEAEPFIDPAEQGVEDYCFDAIRDAGEYK